MLSFPHHHLYVKAQPAAGTSLEPSAPSGSMAVLRNADGEEESQARESTGRKQEYPEGVPAHLYSPKTVGKKHPWLSMWNRKSDYPPAACERAWQTIPKQQHANVSSTMRPCPT